MRQSDRPTPQKMSFAEILDNVDVVELHMGIALGAIAALAVFIGLSYLTGSSAVASGLGLTAGLFVGYRVLLYTAQLPRKDSTDSK